MGEARAPRFVLDPASRLLGADAIRRWLPTERKNTNLAERLLLTALVLDAFVLTCGLLVAFWLRFNTAMHEIGVPAKLTLRDYAGYILFGAFSLLTALSYFEVYDSRRLLRFRPTAERIVKACSLWFVCFLGVSLMFKFQPPISRIYVVISACTVTTGLLGWRYVFHRVLQQSRTAVNLRQRVLFVGWNEESQQLSNSFETDAVHPYEVVGCVPSSGLAVPRETGRAGAGRVFRPGGDLPGAGHQHGPPERCGLREGRDRGPGQPLREGDDPVQDHPFLFPDPGLRPAYGNGQRSPGARGVAIAAGCAHEFPAETSARYPGRDRRVDRFRPDDRHLRLRSSGRNRPARFFTGSGAWAGTDRPSRSSRSAA